MINKQNKNGLKEGGIKEKLFLKESAMRKEEENMFQTKQKKTSLGILLLCLLFLWFASAFTVYGAEQPKTEKGKTEACYPGLEKGQSIAAYPLSTGSITVYEDSDRITPIGKVKGKNLLVTIKKAEGDSFYGTYKTGSKKYSGWFQEKDFVKNPSYKQISAMARYSAKAYQRKSGSSFGKVPAYAALTIIGKSGSWYQVVYQYKSAYRMGWMKKSAYDIVIRIYDGTEKRVMAEGIYYISPQNSSSKRIAGEETVLKLAKAENNQTQKFEFKFTGSNCYKIIHQKTGLCLSAAVAEGEYMSQVVLSKNSEEEIPGQIWQLIRNGGYYYLKNKGTGKYLKAGVVFTTAKKSSSTQEKFKITKADGKNKSNWQVFTQYDPEWGGKKYGKTNTMAGAACGILSLTNAVYALNGQFIEPMKLAAYAVKTKYRVENHGTDCGFFKAAAKKYGKDYGFAYTGSTKSLTVLKKHLKAGGTAIAYVPGHYMAVADYKNGKYLALDSYARSKRKTSPYGDWVKGSRFKSGGLKAKAFFLLKAK